MDEISATTLAQAQFLASWLNSQLALGTRDGELDRRLDANETNMLALQLEQMMSRVYETEYPELKARSLFPVDNEVDPNAETFAYEETDDAGAFRRLSGDGYADDPPTVESSSTKIIRTIEDYGGSFIYTMRDLRRAAFAGRPLSARKPRACRRAWEDKLDQVVAFGDPGSSITTGIANRPLGTGAHQTRSTAFTTADWTPASADPDGMLADLFRFVKEYVVDCREIYEPTDMALPLAHYLLMHQTYFTDGTGETVATRFMRDNGFVRRVHSWEALKAANHGVEATDRALLWRADMELGAIVIPQDFMVMAPQIHNYTTKTLAYGRTAGFCVHRPLAFRYGTALPA